MKPALGLGKKGVARPGVSFFPDGDKVAVIWGLDVGPVGGFRRYTVWTQLEHNLHREKKIQLDCSDVNATLKVVPGHPNWYEIVNSTQVIIM